jgi:hypothetical protein
MVEREEGLPNRNLRQSSGAPLHVVCAQDSGSWQLPKLIPKYNAP